MLEALLEEYQICKDNCQRSLQSRDPKPSREWYAGKLEAFDEIFAMMNQYRDKKEIISTDATVK